MTRPALRLTTLGLLAALGAACSGPAGPVDGSRARAHARSIVDFGPRPPGSKPHRQTADYIAAELGKLGLKARFQEFPGPGTAADTTFRNVWVEIPGTDPKGRILAIGAHYDSKRTDAEHDFEFVGALDSAASCGLLLELARALTTAEKRPLTPTVWLIWFDGEESLEWDWDREAIGVRNLIGSSHFVKAMSADKELFPDGFSKRLRVLVLLDLIGDANQKIDKDTESNGKLLSIFEQAATAMGEGERMYRYESPMTDDHVPFRRNFVNVIDLIDFRWRWEGDAPRPGEAAPAEGEYEKWWHTERDTMDRVSADSLSFVGNLVWNALPSIDAEFYK